MLQQSDIEKLHRYINGLSDQEEQEYIHSLFSEGDENQRLKNYLQSDWNDYLKNGNPEFGDLPSLLDHIHHLIHLKEIRKEPTVVHKINKWYTLAAAIFLIPMLIAGGFLIGRIGSKQKLLIEKPLTSTLLAPIGSRVSFTLPDGSRGWLNSGSSLVYAIPFSNHRQVMLQGEALFEVAHDADNPFEISTGNSKIKVLGTRFNVNAYTVEKYVEVVLENGKLEFSPLGDGSVIVMAPNERLVYQNGTVRRSVTDAAKYVAWKDGKLVFRGDPMSEVARRIERWYNVKVEVVDKRLEQYVFRATFQDDSLEEVLRLLSLTSPIGYRIVDGKMLSDGTIEKKKVMLYYRKK
jgi:transmembrane sensor